MKIAWLPRASTSLEQQLTYIAERSPKAAVELGDRIFAAVDRLAIHPESARRGRVDGTRELVVVGTPYIVVYMLRQDTILILRILHGHQRWPSSFGK